MGNTNCVADGGTPHEMTINVSNKTPYTLRLDPSVTCGEKCQHRGFGAQDGKFVEGFQPADSISPGDSKVIKASGREASPIAPKGWIQYTVQEHGCQICKAKITYDSAGWTSAQNRSMVQCDIFETAGGLQLTRRVEIEGGDSNRSENRKYTVYFEMGGQNVHKAGEDAIAPLEYIGSVFRPGSISKGSGARVLIMDSTPSAKGHNGGLVVAWYVGSDIGAFDKTAVTRREDGFQAALVDVASYLDANGVKLGELQFWCHGGAGGKVYCGDSLLDAANAFKVLRGKVANYTKIWFRSCSTIAESDERMGYAPGVTATAFASAVQAAVGCEVVVAGHTVNIGQGGHGSLYAYVGQRWIGPAEDKGRPDDALHHYFDQVPR